MNVLAQYDNVYPLLAPVDSAASAEVMGWIDMSQAHSIAFVSFFGNLTSTSADQVVTLTVEAAAAAATGSEAAVPFTYRVSTAAGTNSWGVVTAATSAGATITTASDDNKFVWIEIDPVAVQSNVSSARYIRLVHTPEAGTATLNGAMAIISPRFKQASMNAVSA